MEKIIEKYPNYSKIDNLTIYLVNNMSLLNARASGTKAYTITLLRHLSRELSNITLIGTGPSNHQEDVNFISVSRKSRISDIRFIAKLFLTKKPQNSIIHFQLPIYVPPYLCPKNGNFLVVTLHGDNVKAIQRKRGKIIGKIYESLEGYALSRVDKIIAVDETTKEVYLKRWPQLKDKTVVIPAGIDLNIFKRIDTEKILKKYGFNKEDKIILYVGRLRKDKGVDILIKAFNKIEKRMKGAKLVIVGAGKEKEKLKALVPHLGIEDVLFMGTLGYENIPEIMSCADVFVLCSLYESGPLVVQESLSCGTPVVTTNVGRVKEFIINEKVGRIVERDEESVANGIIDVFGMNKEVTVKACIDASRSFSFENTAKQIIDVYRSLLGE